MNSYGFLASRYDGLTGDVPYKKWADYLERLFARAGRKIRTVVDLACGTGSLTVELAGRGYQMIGVDRSADMLAVAAEKCNSLPVAPLLIQQDMSKLTLLEQVDGVVCCLDSLNYVTRPQEVRRALCRVYGALRPGGLFVFDIRTPEFLRAMHAQTFLDEGEDVFCVWRGEFSAKRNILTYFMDLFIRDRDELWTRGGELHEEYAYPPEELADWLVEAGFIQVRQYGDLKLRPPYPGEERIFFAASKGMK